MVASEVRLKKETASGLYFSHSHASGWIFFALGAGGAYVWFAFVDHAVARWVFAVGLGLFAILGFVAALCRYELMLNLASGTYRRRRGWIALYDKLSSIL